MFKCIEIDEVAMPIGPYSQGMIHNNIIYLSGSIPINPDGEIVIDTIENQTELVINNIMKLLKSASSGLDKVIKTTCFLTSLKDFPKFNEVYSRYFVHNPARSCVEVSGLPKGVNVEIEVIAFIK